MNRVKLVYALVFAVGGMLLTGCGLSGFGPCDQYKVPTSRPVPFSLILLDLNSNSDETLRQVTQGVMDYVSDDLLTEGTYIKLVASGGDGSPISTSACFDGVTSDGPFWIGSLTETEHQRSRLQEDMMALQREVSGFVNSITVTRTGTATRLLSFASQDLEALTRSPRKRAGVQGVRVVVWSSLLGNTRGQWDCLNLNGGVASANYARGIVRRCFDSGQLRPMYGSSIQFIGVGRSAVTTEQSVLVRDLVAELCRRLSEDCHT